VLPQFFTEYPQAKDQIRLYIYGAQLDRKSKEWLNETTYQDNVIERGRLEFDPGIGLTGRQRIAIEMQQSDILLLLHGNTEWCREYIPSKLYDYYWTNRPIWGLVYENPQLNNLLTKRESYVSDAKNSQAILDSLRKIYADWIAKALPEPSIPAISVKDAVQKILSEVGNSK
jgi:hypothetical protein